MADCARYIPTGLVLLGAFACPGTVGIAHAAESQARFIERWSRSYAAKATAVTMSSGIAKAARKQIGETTSYDPTYVGIDYPDGDIPRDKGVCTDVVIRALRDGRSTDLQRLVHEDMKRRFGIYPNLWNARRPDRNIDHRRVANLMVYLAEHATPLSLSRRGEDYAPGDIVVWMLTSGRLHIGIVGDGAVGTTGRRKIIHNIGVGTQAQDVLFAWPILGHFRWTK